MAYRVLRRGLYFASVAGCLTSQTGRGGSAHTQNRGRDASTACGYESNNVVKSRALISCVVRILAHHKGPSTHTPPSHLPSLARTLWGLVWFGLVGFSFDASLGPQRRARKRGRLAEAALAHHALWDRAEYPEKSRPDPWAACAAERRLTTSR